MATRQVDYDTALAICRALAQQGYSTDEREALVFPVDPDREVWIDARALFSKCLKCKWLGPRASDGAGLCCDCQAEQQEDRLHEMVLRETAEAKSRRPGLPLALQERLPPPEDDGGVFVLADLLDQDNRDLLAMLHRQWWVGPTDCGDFMDPVAIGRFRRSLATEALNLVDNPARPISKAKLVERFEWLLANNTNFNERLAASGLGIEQAAQRFKDWLNVIRLEGREQAASRFARWLAAHGGPIPASRGDESSRPPETPRLIDHVRPPETEAHRRQAAYALPREGAGWRADRQEARAEEGLLDYGSAGESGAIYERDHGDEFADPREARDRACSRLAIGCRKRTRRGKEFWEDEKFGGAVGCCLVLLSDSEESIGSEAKEFENTDSLRPSVRRYSRHDPWPPRRRGRKARQKGWPRPPGLIHPEDRDLVRVTSAPTAESKPPVCLPLPKESQAEWPDLTARRHGKGRRRIVISSPGVIARGVAGRVRSSVLIGVTFMEITPRSRQADFAATIDWGDGGTSAGTISWQPGTYTKKRMVWVEGVWKGATWKPGRLRIRSVSRRTSAYTVNGSHTYAKPGEYPVVVTIIDCEGRDVTIRGTATVAAAQARRNGKARQARQ